MRYFLVIFLFGCQSITAQNESDTAKKDREFMELMSKVDANTEASVKVQQEASKKQSQIVKQTVTQIVGLKQENKNLKTELNEVKKAFDSISNDTIMPFKLLPISNKKDI